MNYDVHNCNSEIVLHNFLLFSCKRNRSWTRPAVISLGGYFLYIIIQIVSMNVCVYVCVYMCVCVCVCACVCVCVCV